MSTPPFSICLDVAVYVCVARFSGGLRAHCESKSPYAEKDKHHKLDLLPMNLQAASSHDFMAFRIQATSKNKL
jgi:hypothetical protein